MDCRRRISNIRAAALIFLGDIASPRFMELKVVVVEGRGTLTESSENEYARPNALLTYLHCIS